MKSNKLYLIPTPIGNYDDITIRSLKILELVDVLLCEDTRETGKLLSNFNIKKRLVSCHDHNEEQMCVKVIEYLDEGLNVGLVTDQGTPIISDPGYKIVAHVAKENYNIVSLPGATAFVPALTLSALAPQPFLFYGFLNSKNSKQKQELEALKLYPYTMIFYEAPHRIINTLENMRKIFGNRHISLSREISKLYEEIYRGTIDEVLGNFDKLKGEFVLIVEGNTEHVDFSDIDIISHVKLYLDDGLSEMDAFKKVAKERGISKSIVYKEYNDFKDESK